jgi:hypothetical protein
VRSTQENNYRKRNDLYFLVVKKGFSEADLKTEEELTDVTQPRKERLRQT